MMPQNIQTNTLEVKKDDWRSTRIVEANQEAELADNEVLFRVERLALTSNNITYAATGDALGYWGFFPADEGWGRIPAMGWAEVVDSAHPDISAGERVWGWFPFSTHLRIVAGKVNATGFTDVSEHRAPYAPVYSRFDRAAANPLYDPAREDQDSLLRGLFMTSWLVEDFLDVNDMFSADSCLITSASSKTSVALGFCVKNRRQLKSIAVTSARNAAFCERVGCYDQVVLYDNIDTLDASAKAVMVDMAGNSDVISAVHHHLGENLQHSCRIGATHYEKSKPLGDLPGPKPEFFFAPTHVKSRSDELGRDELMKRMGMTFAGFRQFCDGWLQIQQNLGADAVDACYQAVLAGGVDPSHGQIISMWPE